MAHIHPRTHLLHLSTLFSGNSPQQSPFFRVPALPCPALLGRVEQYLIQFPSRTLPVDQGARLLHTPPLMFSNRSRGGELVAFIFLVDKEKEKKEKRKKKKKVHISAGKAPLLPSPSRDSKFLFFS